MVRLFLTLVSVVFAMSAFSDDSALVLRARKYAMDRGAHPDTVGQFVCRDGVILHWKVPGVQAPTPQQLSEVTNPEISAYALSDLTLDDKGKYRAKTEAEKKAEADVAIAAKQAVKPLSQKKLENRYIRICDDVLGILGDPRAKSSVAIPVPELYTLMDAADAKNKDEELTKATRQLLLTLRQLDAADPAWFSGIKYDATAGE